MSLNLLLIPALLSRAKSKSWVAPDDAAGEPSTKSAVLDLYPAGHVDRLVTEGQLGVFDFRAACRGQSACENSTLILLSGLENRRGAPDPSWKTVIARGARTSI